MPSEQCLRRHHSRDLFQSTAANSFGLPGKAASLIVGEPHSLSSTRLLQDSDLLLQVVDHVLLLLVHPACKRHHYQSDYVHFGFLPSQTEEIQLEISSLLSLQPIESHQLTSQSNFWTLRGRRKTCAERLGVRCSTAREEQLSHNALFGTALGFLRLSQPSRWSPW
ncbi:MAG: hypothetical protein ACI8T1_002981 [Verrucomicrobiales bacterium]|jgi:hypothetical protein